MRKVQQQLDRVLCDRESDASDKEQNCLYIPPGYHNHEEYRLATFAQFPTYAPVKITGLAAAGFLFTGFKDRVKCFSCGIAVENWMEGDDAMDKKWHKSECKMAVGTEHRNVPIPIPNFRTVFSSLARKDENRGIATIGNKNYAQSIFTRPAFTRCRSVRQIDSGNNLLTDEIAASDPPIVFARTTQMRDAISGIVKINTENTRTVTGPEGPNCLYIPPGFHDNEKYRLATFSQFPADVPLKVTDLAAAGFYFTGFKATVQCFSCGVAIQNWMDGDDVMDEKWHKTECKMAFGGDPRNVPIPTPNFRTLFRSLAGKI